MQSLHNTIIIIIHRAGAQNLCAPESIARATLRRGIRRQRKRVFTTADGGKGAKAGAERHVGRETRVRGEKQRENRERRDRTSGGRGEGVIKGVNINTGEFSRRRRSWDTLWRDGSRGHGDVHTRSLTSEPRGQPDRRAESASGGTAGDSCAGGGSPLYVPTHTG